MMTIQRRAIIMLGNYPERTCSGCGSPIGQHPWGDYRYFVSLRTDEEVLKGVPRDLFGSEDCVRSAGISQID